MPFFNVIYPSEVFVTYHFWPETPEPVPDRAMKLFNSLTGKKRSFKDMLRIEVMQHDDLDPGEHIPDLHPDFDPDEIHIVDVDDL